jgi:hypothetical protein
VREDGSLELSFLYKTEPFASPLLVRRLINSTYVSLDGVVTNPQEWTFPF